MASLTLRWSRILLSLCAANALRPIEKLLEYPGTVTMAGEKSSVNNLPYPIKQLIAHAVIINELPIHI